MKAVLGLITLADRTLVLETSTIRKLRGGVERDILLVVVAEVVAEDEVVKINLGRMERGILAVAVGTGLQRVEIRHLKLDKHLNNPNGGRATVPLLL